MTIIWRFLLGEYIKVLLFCVLSIIGVLLTTRIDDIAQFAIMGPDPALLVKFILLQIPYILPIALPIACLISAILLIQRLSESHELTALRACGLSLWDILAPILLGALLLSCLNFYFISELATESHLATGLLKNELRSINPLSLVHNKHIKRARGFYYEAAGETIIGESAKDVVFALPSKSGASLNLLVARELRSSNQQIESTGLTLITSVPIKDRQTLVIENSAHTLAAPGDFTQLIHKNIWTLNNDHLNFAMLRVRREEEKAKLINASPEEQPIHKRQLTKINSEIVKRYSVALAVFTFTLMGAAFGVNISRTRSNRGIYAVITLSTLYLVCFFAGKGVEHQFWSASLLFFTPHLLMTALSLFMLQRAAKGVE